MHARQTSYDSKIEHGDLDLPLTMIDDNYKNP